MTDTSDTDWSGKFAGVHEDAATVPAEEERRQISVDALIQQIQETAEKLGRDEISRADVKLVTTALRELRYAFKVFAQFKDYRKVTVFGSARTPTDAPEYQMSVEFGQRIAREGYMVITGAGGGIMEAGQIGAGLDKSLGLSILLPFEQTNSFMAEDPKLVHHKYFFTRKLMFVKEADAVALFPGGFGTQDENWEVLTLVQTGKSHLFPIVLIDVPGGGYWHEWLRFVEKVMLPRGYISPEDLSLFRITESVDEAVEEITGFYRNYHSMRYVGDHLVLRFHSSMSEENLERIQTEYADILVGGDFEQTAAQPEEANEPEIKNLIRLKFQYDRRSQGRLRELVNFINRV